MKYIDIHSHLGQEGYGDDQAAVIQRMKDLEVGTITIGTTLEDSREAVKIAETNENVWACIGVHPTENNGGDFDLAEFERLIVHPKVVAIGECGLDYYRISDPSLRAGRSKPELDCHGNTLAMTEEKIKERQKNLFIQQIELAVKYNKPLMLHIRDGVVRRQAYEDVFNILKNYEGKVKGDVHFFAGGLDWAKKFIELGFTISFTGLITYVPDFNKIIKNVPLEALQAETDAPYVAPVPHRGERNEPSYVIEIYRQIAEIRAEDPEKVRLQLLANAKRVFGV